MTKNVVLIDNIIIVVSYNHCGIESDLSNLILNDAKRVCATINI